MYSPELERRVRLLVAVAIVAAAILLWVHP